MSNAKLSLNVKLSQQLSLTPQLQQAIFLLQLTSVELQQTIQEYIETNPFLETKDSEPKPESDSKGKAETTADTDKPIDSVTANQSISNNRYDNAGADSDYIIAQQTKESTLRDHLMLQINESHFNDIEELIAISIVDAIDDNGLLRSTTEELQNSLDTHSDIDSTTIDGVIQQIQRFDPPGIAAKNAQECLILQLQRLPNNAKWRSHAVTIIEQHLELLAKRDFSQLMQRCKVTEDELHHIIDLIHTLNPRPGQAFATDNNTAITPDVIVKKLDHHWVVQLNQDTLPNLHINHQYAAMIKQKSTKNDSEFLKDNLQEARWLLRSISKRNETLMKVATYIVEKQQGFLEHGTSAMKPMVISEVARAIEMHDSTISRVSRGKYISTPQGVFELKYFFSSQLSSDGGNTSGTAVRSLIKEMITAENTKKPLSDSIIADKLKEKGVSVARRTVAKYREAMGIPPSSRRKSI